MISRQDAFNTQYLKRYTAKLKCNAEGKDGLLYSLLIRHFLSKYCAVSGLFHAEIVVLVVQINVALLRNPEADEKLVTAVCWYPHGKALFTYVYCVMYIGFIAHYT